MNNIIQFKLSSGEWVIGKEITNNTVNTDDAVTGDNVFNAPGQVIFIAEPLTIAIFPDKNTYGVRFLPFDPLNTSGIKAFQTSGIVAQSLEISKQVIDAYTAQTSSIEIVSSITGV